MYIIGLTRVFRASDAREVERAESSDNWTYDTLQIHTLHKRTGKYRLTTWTT